MAAASRTNFEAAAASSTTRPPIPLTTLFTPPASCLDVVTYDGTTLWQGGISQTGDADCYPSGFSNIINSYFTPGICPQSWTSVGTAAAASAFPPGATDAMCCPSSYFLSSTRQGILGYFCASLVSTDLTNVWSTSIHAEGGLEPNAPLTTLKKADLKHNTVFADVIQVRWDSQNPRILSLMAEETASGNSQSSAVKKTGGTPATPASMTEAGSPSSTSGQSTSSSGSSSGGLSTGAEAGIGIGVALVAVIVAVGAFLLFRRQRRRRKTQRTGDGGGAGGVGELPADEQKPYGLHEMEQRDGEVVKKTPMMSPVEMDAGNIGELQGEEGRAELAGGGGTQH